jgi:hypothetical protein
MAKRAPDRFQSAVELRRALEAIPAVWTAAEAQSFRDGAASAPVTVTSSTR